MLIVCSQSYASWQWALSVWIAFDHLHMLLSMTTDGDERRNIDSIMHNFRTLVEETGVGLILVSHLRRIDGNRGHENGIETGLNHLRGRVLLS